MWLLWQRKLSLRFKSMRRKIRRKRLNKWIWLGPPIQWTCKLTIRERYQPLESDTDAQLYKERVITVRKAAEVGSRVPQEICPGEMRVDVMAKSFRKRSRSRRKLQWRHKCKGKHRWSRWRLAARSRTYRCPTSSRQQRSRQVQRCRPRADSSAVVRFIVADLEPASLRDKVAREREKLHTKIGSRRHFARRAWSTRLGQEGRKAPSDRGKARRQRGTMPGQQRRPHSAERRCIARKKRGRSEEEATFSRKTELGNKQKGKRRRNSASGRKTDQQNSKAWELQPACNAREKRQEQDAQSQPTAVWKTLRSRWRSQERERERESWAHLKGSSVSSVWQWQYQRKKPEEREARIDDTPAVPNEPTDHAVARGRDVSLRYERGHSPENHTVVSEWCWKPPTNRSGNEPLRPVLQVSRTRCCKLHDQGARALTAS